jgi:hypothetical protein
MSVKRLNLIFLRAIKAEDAVTPCFAERGGGSAQAAD